MLSFFSCFLTSQPYLHVFNSPVHPIVLLCANSVLGVCDRVFRLCVSFLRVSLSFASVAGAVDLKVASALPSGKSN